MPQSSISEFRPGLVLNRPADVLSPGEAWEATNVELDRGTIRSRDGWVPSHSAALPAGIPGMTFNATFNLVFSASDPSTVKVTALMPLYRTAGDQLVAIAGTDLIYQDAGGTSVAVASSSIVASSPVRASYVSIENALYIALKHGAGEDVAQLKKWTGTAYSTVSGSPTGFLIGFYNNSLWMAGNTSFPSRLNFSRYTPFQETWPTSNFIDIAPGDGDRITGFAQLQNSFTIFKERSIHRLVGGQPDDATDGTDEGDLNINSEYNQPGCIAPRSTAVTKNNVIYVSRDGIYLYDGVRPRELSESIRSIFEDISYSLLREAIGVLVTPSHYLLLVPDAYGTGDSLFVSIHFAPKFAITTWRNLNAHAVNTFRFTGSSEQVVLGLVGSIGKMQGYHDNGTAIEWVYGTPILQPSGPSVSQWLKRLSLESEALASGRTVKVGMYKNGNSPSQYATHSPVPTSGTPRSVLKRLPWRGFARFWGLELKSNSGQTTQSPELYKVLLETESGRR